jgi:hypothetical protein
MNPISPKQGCSGVRKTISLERLLNRTAGVILNRRQRFFISFTVASAQLQLHSTPWLGEQWSKENILFLYDNPEDPSSIRYDQPFLSCTLASPTIQTAQTDILRATTFSTLGILLLELCFGVPFETTPIWKVSLPANGANAVSNRGAAIGWASEVTAEAGQEYADAVMWCLTKFVAGGMDDAWRKDVLTNVVEPLQKCHDSLK